MDIPGALHYRFGPYSMIVTERVIVRGEERIPLEPRVFDTLRVLLEHRGVLVSKETLMQKVWADAVVEEGSLARNISVLRRTFTDGGPYIETIPRVGYRFASGTVPPAGSLQAGATNSAGETPRRRWVAVAAALAATVAGAAIFFTVRIVGAGRAPVRSIAVVPLDVRGSRSDLDYLGAGVAEGVTFHLSRVPGLKVISADTMRAYGSRGLTSEALARELGVEALVTGSILPHKAGALIDVELVDPLARRSLWGEQYEVPASEMASLPSNVAAEVSQKLRMHITGEVTESLRRDQLHDPEAYRLYLKGRFFLNKRTSEGTERAIDFFRQAAARDPGYALAWAGLADAYRTSGNFFSTEPREQLLNSKEAALKALELDPSLAEAHVSLGFIRLSLDWDWKGGERAYDHALALNPNYATAHQFRGVLLATTGRFDESIWEAQRAEELDPLSLPINASYAWLLVAARRYDEAIVQAQKTLEMEPTYRLAISPLGEAYYQKKMYAQAAETWNRRVDPAEAAALSAAFREGGIDGYIRKGIELTVSSARQSGSDPSVPLALAYARLGDRDQAFKYLEQTYKARSGWLIWLAAHPGFDNLRSDPRYQSLVSRVGIPYAAPAN